jgi:RNA polymerase sigma-70 factor (ECF subfamily)
MSRSIREGVRVSSAHPRANEAPPDALVGWLEATRRGDAEAARKLLEAVAPALRNVITRALGRGHPDAEDLLQESLLGFVRALDSFRGECSVLHYARRIALWRVLEEQKRRRAQKRAPELPAARDPDRSASEARAHGDALAARRREQLRELLLSLRPEQAEALALRHVLDYSVEEIAATTAVPANTVRSRLRLAKEALRARIAGNPLLSELDIRQP